MYVFVTMCCCAPAGVPLSATQQPAQATRRATRMRRERRRRWQSCGCYRRESAHGAGAQVPTRARVAQRDERGRTRCLAEFLVAAMVRRSSKLRADGAAGKVRRRHEEEVQMVACRGAARAYILYGVTRSARTESAPGTRGLVGFVAEEALRERGQHLLLFVFGTRQRFCSSCACAPPSLCSTASPAGQSQRVAALSRAGSRARNPVPTQQSSTAKRSAVQARR